MSLPHNPVAKQARPLLTNRSYDLFRDGAQIGFPAFITLYTAVATIWQWAHTTEVVGTLAAFNVFLGVVVKIAARQYESSGAKYDGTVTVIDRPEDDARDIKFSTTTDPYVAASQKEIVYKVENPHPLE